MFTAEQYRAKAAEFKAFLTNALRSSSETSELRHLEQTYTTLAENEEWMATHLDKTLQRRKDSDSRTALVEEEEQILKCLGAALIMHWNTVPTKLQRELFDCACGIGDPQQTTPLKGQIAASCTIIKTTSKSRIEGRGRRAPHHSVRAHLAPGRNGSSVRHVCPRLAGMVAAVSTTSAGASIRRVE